MECWHESYLAYLLKTLGCDLENEAVQDFAELVFRIATYRLSNPLTEYGAGRCFMEQSKVKGRFYRAYDGWIKRSIPELFKASDELLHDYGVHFKKRTVCSFAWAFSELLICPETF